MFYGPLSSHVSLPLIGTVYATHEAAFKGSTFIDLLNEGHGVCLFIGRWRFAFDRGQRPLGVPVLVAFGCALALANAVSALVAQSMRRLCVAVVGQRVEAEGEGQS